MHAWTLSEVFHELSDHGILYVEAIPCSYDGRRDIMVHILIVEDDSELNQFVCSYLNNSGFSAKGCLNARDAYDEMYNRNLLGGLYRENPVKSRNYEAVKSSKKWENVGNSYIIPALLLYRYSYI